MGKTRSYLADDMPLQGLAEEEAAHWKKVVLRFRSPLAGFFFKRVPDKTLVDDLVQEVFMRLIRRKSDEPIEKLEQYIFQTAANVLRDHARRQAVRQTGAHESFDEAVHPGSDISPERVIEGREQLALLTAAIKEMPERTRDIFVLRVLEKKKCAEVAQMMGLSTRAVEKHMVKAFAYVNHMMEKKP